MTKRIITYMIAAAATIYTAILYGSTSFLMLFYAELLLPAVLLLTVLPTIHSMTVRLRLPVSVTEQGKASPVWLELHSGKFPLGGKVAVQVKGILPMGQKPEKVWFYTRLAGRKNLAGEPMCIRTEYHARCVGNIRMEITKVWCYDVLGIVALPLPARYWKSLEPETLLVLPRICEMPVAVSRQSRDFAGESEEHSKERGGDDPSEIFQIRDYQPGDKLRSIHWKLSAKVEDIMVREQSLPLGCPVEFYLDLYQAHARREKHTIRRDNYLQIAASVSHSMVREGCRHYMIWYDTTQKDIRRYRIEKEENILEVLLQLGQLVMYHEKYDLQEMYRQKYHETPPVTVLTLTMELVLKKGTQEEARFSGSAEDVERQLGSRELLV